LVGVDSSGALAHGRTNTNASIVVGRSTAGLPSNGSVARGFAENSGSITSQGHGSVASGYTNASSIRVTGDGSFAYGSANGGNILVVGTGSGALGRADGPNQNINVTADNALAVGSNALADQPGARVLSLAGFSQSGDAQTIVLSLQAQNAAGASAELLLGGITRPQMTLQNSAWSFDLTIVGQSTTTTSAVSSWKYFGSSYNSAGVVTVVGTNLISSISSPGFVVSPPVAVGNQIVISVTAPDSAKWYATLSITQVAQSS
jgi:hypothetical protein